jgi:hypothetical protein
VHYKQCRNGSETTSMPESPVQLGLTGLSRISSELRRDMLLRLVRENVGCGL